MLLTDFKEIVKLLQDCHAQLVKLDGIIDYNVFSKHNALILRLLETHYEEDAISRLLNTWLIKGGNLTVILPSDEENIDIYVNIDSIEDLWNEMEKFKKQ